MVVTPDSDKNNKFNDKDETTVFQINPVTDTIPVELFSNDFKNSLKVLHSKNWNQ